MYSDEECPLHETGRGRKWSDSKQIDYINYKYMYIGSVDKDIRCDYMYILMKLSYMYIQTLLS